MLHEIKIFGIPITRTKLIENDTQYVVDSVTNRNARNLQKQIQAQKELSKRIKDAEKLTHLLPRDERK